MMYYCKRFMTLLLVVALFLTGAPLYAGTANAAETRDIEIGNEMLALMQDISQDITFQNDVWLDLDGYSITGTVTIAEGCTLYVMDYQTDDYTVANENGYGKIAKYVGNVEPMDGYMMVEEEDGVSFHRVDYKITSMTLRPECAGIYYNGTFCGDELVASRIARFGVALRIGQAPDAGYMGKSSAYSRYDGFAAGEAGNGVTGTLLTGVMKTGNSSAVNDSQAKLKIWGAPYMLTVDGEYLFGEAVSRSLMEQVQLADSMWGSLTAAQKNGMRAMYNTYSGVMENWYLPNMNNTDIDVPF